MAFQDGQGRRLVTPQLERLITASRQELHRIRLVEADVELGIGGLDLLCCLDGRRVR